MIFMVTGKIKLVIKLYLMLNSKMTDLVTLIQWNGSLKTGSFRELIPKNSPWDWVHTDDHSNLKIPATTDTWLPANSDRMDSTPEIREPTLGNQDTYLTTKFVKNYDLDGQKSGIKKDRYPMPTETAIGLDMTTKNQFNTKSNSPNITISEVSCGGQLISMISKVHSVTRVNTPL